MKFEVRLSKFEFDLDFWAKVRQVRSSNMPEFGSSKFEIFEFVPPLILILIEEVHIVGTNRQKVQRRKKKEIRKVVSRTRQGFGELIFKR